MLEEHNAEETKVHAVAIKTLKGVLINSVNLRVFRMNALIVQDTSMSHILMKF